MKLHSAVKKWCNPCENFPSESNELNHATFHVCIINTESLYAMGPFILLPIYSIIKHTNVSWQFSMLTVKCVAFTRGKSLQCLLYKHVSGLY